MSTPELDAVASKIAEAEEDLKEARRTGPIHANLAELRRKENNLTSPGAPAAPTPAPAAPGYTISDISKSVYEADPEKFIRASLDQLPYEFFTIPIVTSVAVYSRFYAPWRHARWPYTESQASWRQATGYIRLSAPYHSPKKFFPLIAGAWVMDKLRKAFRSDGK